MVETAELSPGLFGWIRPGAMRVDPASPREWLDAQPRSYLRRVEGRETFAWPIEPASLAQFIVKRTQARDSGSREFSVLEALERDGFAVPRAVAWCEERAWLGTGRSCVVMERVPHASTLRERLAACGAAEQRRWCVALLDLVARLHERGWYHRDLYLQHVVVRERAEEGPGLVLLDVGRARHSERPRKRWFVKDLAALLHSTPRAVGLWTRLRFLAGYLDRRGVTTRRKRRRWLARIETRARRMAAHRPKAGEDKPWQDQ
jgi:RIO-like serine/threonine protein kinase